MKTKKDRATLDMSGGTTRFDTPKFAFGKFRRHIKRYPKSETKGVELKTDKMSIVSVHFPHRRFNSKKW